MNTPPRHCIIPSRHTYFQSLFWELVRLAFKTIHCVYASLRERKLPPLPLQPRRSWLFWKHVVRGWGPTTAHDPPPPGLPGPRPAEEHAHRRPSRCQATTPSGASILPSPGGSRQVQTKRISRNTPHCRKRAPELLRAHRQHLLGTCRVPDAAPSPALRSGPWENDREWPVSRSGTSGGEMTCPASQLTRCPALC